MKKVALLLALALICGMLLCACAPEEDTTLSTPDNKYVVAQALVYVNGALYLRENGDGHIYTSLPDGYERVGNVGMVLPYPEGLEEELSAWELLAGQMIYASEKDPGCVYVHYPLSAETYCYVKFFRADLYEYWTPYENEE